MVYYKPYRVGNRVVFGRPKSKPRPFKRRNVMFDPMSKNERRRMRLLKSMVRNPPEPTLLDLSGQEGPFPATLCLPMKIVLRELWSTGSANRSGFYFTGNNLTVPSTQFSGSLNPSGYDEYKALYENFLVMGSSIKVTVVNEDDTSPLRVTVYPDAFPLAPFSTYTINPAEMPNAKTVLLNYETAVQETTCTLYHKASTRQILGYLENPLSDPIEFSGAFDAGTGDRYYNDNNAWYWNVAVENPDTSYTSQGFILHVEITYDTYLWSRKPLQPS